MVQACIDYCFFYIVNHGLDKECLSRLFDESKRFFSLPLEERMKLSKKEVRGYAPLYSDKLDHSSSQTKADSRESFCIGRLDGEACNLNHWPSEGDFADCNEEILGASAHSDYGIITLLATDGDRGLQACLQFSESFNLLFFKNDIAQLNSLG
ncbi:hypothetical protein Cgig2_019919 [Carnegiea gigantea]|uniref:Non-haem dioxygenase N-terminal domain-containing protein n=1 Tax=Carnegiea gigantea TaxID=171969 RepID=A0A9Q1QJZ2_9CARY|nr:hypothetical protein Cgig2_019919 [Carnegiea gigantea]